MLTEEDFIALCFKPLIEGNQSGQRGARNPGAAPLANQRINSFDLQDDAASLTQREGYELILSKDILLEGQHFLKNDPPETLAEKALAVNLSDLAAKGATPTGFMLGIALPTAPEREWATAFSNGLKLISERYACPLIGGDTTGSKSGLMLSVTILGEVPAGKMINRHSANKGDHLFVTGTLGDAALGFQLLNGQIHSDDYDLTSEEYTYLKGKYQRPTPRLAASPILQHYATAAMDLSDGLVKDLPKLCTASGLGAEINIQNFPLSMPAQKYLSRVSDSAAALAEIVSWGDDYELLFAVRPDDHAALRAGAEKSGCHLTEIGRLSEATSEGSGVVKYLDKTGKAIPFKGKPFTHFGGDETVKSS
ncbi:MAG: thiamine-monophosphate kinase [Rhodomicrobium sp.]|nr:MAG: thiamine-monophosphate kinase [Rhodomicrobium sp.]